MEEEAILGPLPDRKILHREVRGHRGWSLVAVPGHESIRLG